MPVTIYLRTGFLLFTIAFMACLPVWRASSAEAARLPMPKVGYSANVTMNMGTGPDGNPITVKGKVYVSSDGNQRRVMSSLGRQSIIIKRRDKNVTWTLMPDQKMYMEGHRSSAKKDPQRMMEEGEVKLTRIGSETVNRQRSTKYKVEVTHRDRDRFVGHYWVTRENIPVRMEGTSTGKRFRIDYTNIRTGRQDRRLFEIPAGYSKLVTPGIPGLPHMGTSPGRQMPQGGFGGMTMEQAEQLRKQMEEMQKRMREQFGGGR